MEDAQTFPEIIYEDEDIVVCVKPAGVVCEDAAGDESLPALLRSYFAGKGASNDIYTVHRLDRETRGLMVYARNKKAAAGLSKSISDHLFVKEYEAKVHGQPSDIGVETELTDLLFKDSSKNKVFVVRRMRKGVREARLSYHVESYKDGVSLVRIKLDTGRTHQIRVQFASRGFPVVGDKKYGARDKSPYLALRCVKIAFPHPATGLLMTEYLNDHFND